MAAAGHAYGMARAAPGIRFVNTKYCLCILILNFILINFDFKSCSEGGPSMFIGCVTAWFDLDSMTLIHELKVSVRKMTNIVISTI